MQKCKQFYGSVKNKAAVAGAVALGLVVNAPAHAALDPAIATAMDAIKADAGSLNTLIMPIVISILGMLITYKLIKRFSSKI